MNEWMNQDWSIDRPTPPRPQPNNQPTNQPIYPSIHQSINPQIKKSEQRYTVYAIIFAYSYFRGFGQVR